MTSYRKSPLAQPTLSTEAPPAPFWKLVLLRLADEFATFAGHTSRLQRVRTRAARNYRHSVEAREEQRYQAEHRKYINDVAEWKNSTAPRGPHPMPPMREGWHIPGWWGHG